MANFPTIGLGQAGQNAFNNKWAGYTPPVAPAPTPTAPTQQSTAPKPSTLPTQPAQQGATVIPVTTMGSQQQINIPTQQQPMTAPVTMNYADQLTQQANADSQNTQVQDYQNTSIMQMLDAYNNLAGESAYRTQAIQDSNINGLKQNLQNINNQILTKQAEIQQDDVRLAAGLNNIEKKAIPMEFITGQQQSVQRDAQIARALKMSEIGVLNAQVLAGQGNIELAQKTVEEAVAAKYAPFKEIIDINKQQLEAIAPLLSKAEAKQAAAQKLKTDLSLRKLDKLESDEKLTQKLAIEAGQNGAPKSLIDQALKARPEEAARLLSKYSTDNINYQRKLATAAGTFGVNPKVLNTTQFKAAQNAGQFKTVLKDTIGLVKKYGNYEKLDAAGKGALDAASVQLRSLLSTALEQGVVQPGEAPAFEKALGSLQSGIFKRNKVTIGSLESALRTAELKYNSQASALEGVYGIKRDTLDALTGDISLDEQDYNDMDAII